MSRTIANGCDQPLFSKQGSVPDVSGAMQDYYQSLVFDPVGKVVNGFQVVETGAPISFQGVIQPFTERQLLLKPEGERAWTWLTIYADPVLQLQVDDIVNWNGTQTRIMGRTDFSLYGYMLYHAIQDWTGAGP